MRKINRIFNLLFLSSLFLSTTLIPSHSYSNTDRVFETNATDYSSSSYWDDWISNNQSAINTGGSTLLSALKTKLNSGTTKISYSGLWEAYKTTDLVPGTNYIWDMYAGELYLAGGSKQGANYNAPGDSYNREHSIPKSWWGSTEDNRYSDLVHLVPTDGYVNNKRSNYAFGEVSSVDYSYSFKEKTDGYGNVYQTAGISKLGTGTSINGVSAPGKVFEPDDQYKGDFARIYMYFVARYEGCATSGDGSTMFSSSFPYFTSYGLALIKKWHEQDPVSEKEINRNNGIQQLQGNRNPFVDYPQWANKIFGTNYTGDDLESLSINKTSADLVYGGTVQLSVTPNPSSASSDVTWSSSNTNVATVSSSGLVTAYNKTGSATITATSTSDTSISVSCVVTVSEPSNIDITSISASSISLQVDSTSGIDVSYSPSNAYPTPTYTFESNDTSVATVDNDGSVTGISAGETTITIKAYQDGTLKATTSCAVTVTEKPVVGDSATIEFKTNSSDDTSALDKDKVIDQISGGSEYVDSVTTATKLYPGINGLKLGSNSASGQLVFTVSSSINSYKVTSITINSVKYGSDTGTLTLSVNGSSVLSNISPGSSGTDSTYSPSSSITVNSIGIATSSKRAYLKSITFNFETSSSYTSDDFAEEFYNSINCDVTGVNRPSFNDGKSWSDFKTSYNKLSTTEKNKLIDATYSVSGYGASTVVTPNDETTQSVANAMYRYDYIITKYNTSTYKTFEEFISGRVSSALVTPINYNISTTQSTLIIAISIFAIGITSITIIYIIRKRQEHN